MRVSLFLILLYIGITMLAIIFTMQFPTFFFIVCITIIWLLTWGIGFQVHKKIGPYETPHTNVIACTFAILILFIIISWVTQSLLIHGSIWLIFALQVYGTLYFISHSYRQSMQMETIKSEIHQFNESFMQVSAQRHDYMKHIHVLDYLLEKDGSSEASDYMEQLIPNYQQVNTSIKGEQGHIAAILLKFQTIAASHDLRLTLQLDEALSHMPLQSYEQVELIGNLMENAIDAARESKEEDKYVSLSSSRVSGLYKIEIENTTNPIPDEVINHLFSKIHTSTKPGRHGVGTSIIADITKHYNGVIDYTYNGKKLIIRIALPLIEQSNKE